MMALIPTGRFVTTDSHEYKMQMALDERKAAYLKQEKSKEMNNSKFYKDVVAYNRPEYNYNKLNEELAELLHVSTKMVSKNKDHKPSIKLIAEEAAHVLIRIHVLVEAEGIYELMGSEMKKKMDRIQQWITEGKYQGGV